jgi:hypothetical protein
VIKLNKEDTKNKILKQLRFEKGGTHLWFNAGKYTLHGEIGDPTSRSSKTSYAGFMCCRCGGFYYWDRAIVVRYGTHGYFRNSYCIHCFEKRYPLWKRLLNKLPFFDSYIAKKEKNYLYTRNELFLKLMDEPRYPDREIEGRIGRNWYTTPLNFENDRFLDK